MKNLKTFDEFLNESTGNNSRDAWPDIHGGWSSEYGIPTKVQKELTHAVSQELKTNVFKVTEDPKELTKELFDFLNKSEMTNDFVYSWTNRSDSTSVLAYNQNDRIVVVIKNPYDRFSDEGVLIWFVEK